VARAIKESPALIALARRDPQLFLELETNYFKNKAGRSQAGSDVEDSFVRSLMGRARSKSAKNAQRAATAQEILKLLAPFLPEIADFRIGLSAAMRAERGPADLATTRLANMPDFDFEGRVPLLAEDGLVPGMRVDHYAFGRGTVLRVEGDRVDISFSSLGHETVHQIQLSDRDTFRARNRADEAVPVVPFRSADEQQASQKQINTIRASEHLPPYAENSEAGTVSIARAGNIEGVGTNSTLAARTVHMTHDERAELMTLMRRIGLDPTNTTRDPRFVHHAELASLFDLRSELRRSGRPMPEVVELFVDRDTCNSCAQNLSLVASYLGVAELRIYTRGQAAGSPPLIIRAR
jgi:hypothetical protein